MQTHINESGYASDHTLAHCVLEQCGLLLPIQQICPFSAPACTIHDGNKKKKKKVKA